MSVLEQFLLTEEQKAVVLASGNLLVNAGAGTGKTYTLISKILYLLEKGTKDHKILVITFTKLAAQEVRDRIEKYGYSLTNVFTFHAYCYQLLLKNKTELNLDFLHVVDGPESTDIRKEVISILTTLHDKSGNSLKDLCRKELHEKAEAKSEKLRELYEMANELTRKQMFYELKEIRNEITNVKAEISTKIENIKDDDFDLYRKAIREFGTYISYLKSKITNINEILFKVKDSLGNTLDAELQNESNYRPYLSYLINFFKAYQQLLTSLKLIDYSDLILKTLSLLTTSKKIHQQCKTDFDYIFIDEFQDTSSQFLQILKLLKSETNTLVAIGDDYQSIFSFNGSDRKNITEFKTLFYPQELLLTENYRSTQNILDVANKLMTHENDEFKLSYKNLRSKMKTIGNVEIKIFDKSNIPPTEWKFKPKFNDEFTTFLITTIQKALKRKESVAILYRTYSRFANLKIKEILFTHNIKAIYAKSRKSKFGDSIDGFLAYFKLIIHSEDLSSLIGFVLTPEYKGACKYGFGTVKLTKIRVFSIETKKTILNILMNELDLFLKICKIGKKAAKTIEILEQISGFLNEINKNRENIPISLIKRMIKSDIFRECSELQDLYHELEEELTKGLNIEKILELFGENTEKISLDKVNCLTIHKAKGLEFDNVFILGLENTNFPLQCSHLIRLKDKINSTSFIKHRCEERAEERRLFYVAITRAKKSIFMVSKYDSLVPIKFSKFSQKHMTSHFLEEI